MGMNTKTEAQALTVQRASTKWVFNSQGILTEVPVDTLAHEYDPETLEYQGVLVEPERTNFAPLSHNQNPYTKGPRPIDPLTYGQSDPKGTFLAQHHDTTVDAFSGYFEHFTAPDDTVVTYSVFVKSVNGLGRAGLFVDGSGTLQSSPYFFNFSTKQLGATGASYVRSSGYQAMAEGWYRIWFTVQVNPLGGKLAFRSWGDLDAVFATAFPSLELGHYPTSYIPTNGAPVTRVADVLQRTLGVERNPLQDTLVMDVANAVDLKLLPEYSDTLEVSGTGKAVVTHNGKQGSVHIAGSELVAFSDFEAGNVLTLAADGKGHLRNLSYYPYAVADANSEATGALTNAWEPDSLFADGTTGAFIDVSSEGA